MRNIRHHIALSGYICKDDCDLVYNVDPSDGEPLLQNDAVKDTSQVRRRRWWRMRTPCNQLGETLVDSIGSMQKLEGRLVVFRGTLDVVNAALESLKYQGALDFFGEETVRITVSDRGNNGKGSELTQSTQVEIVVKPVNDAPFVSKPHIALEIEENTDLPIYRATGLHISDVDSVEDICSEGDEMLVKVIPPDRSGRLRLSRKDALNAEGPSTL